MEKAFSTHWKNSTQRRKQRKYQYNAPLHIRQKFVNVHLSPELRKKHNTRSIQVRKDDKVKVLRGTFKGKSGKVERVDLKKSKIFITGIEIIKKEGSKVAYGISPSNLMITEISTTDKKRRISKNGKATS